MVISLYASLLAFIFIGLSVRVILFRRRLKVSVGDGGHPELLRAIRAQANFSEYVPFGLLLLFIAESQGMLPAFVHTLGLSLLIGRLLHAVGISQATEIMIARVAGMMMTFSVLIVTSACLLLAAI